MFGNSGFGSFEDLFNQLAGGAGHSVQKRSTGLNNLLNFVDEGKKKYFIFDLSGKSVKSIDVKDNLEENDYGEMVHNGSKILEIKLDNEEILKYILPKKIKTKNLSHTFSNGILEVTL